MKLHKVVDIHPDDAWYFSRKAIIGDIGKFRQEDGRGYKAPEGYVSGTLYYTDKFGFDIDFSRYFAAVKLEKIDLTPNDDDEAE